jgi:hypothetical protein
MAVSFSGVYLVFPWTVGAAIMRLLPSRDSNRPRRSSATRGSEMTALIVLRNKAIKPLLAAAQPLHPARGGSNPKPIDAHYHTLRLAMQGVFHELGIAA